jgi:hypothetical protein
VGSYLGKTKRPDPKSEPSTSPVTPAKPPAEKKPLAPAPVQQRIKVLDAPPAQPPPKKQKVLAKDTQAEFAALHSEITLLKADIAALKAEHRRELQCLSRVHQAELKAQHAEGQSAGYILGFGAQVNWSQPNWGPSPIQLGPAPVAQHNRNGYERRRANPGP